MAMLQLEDLLRDELAENNQATDWECSVQSLFLKIDPTALSRYRMREYRAAAPQALKNLDAWMEKAEAAGAMPRLDPYLELPKFRLGLEKVCQAVQGSTPTEGDLREFYLAIVEEVDEEVFRFLGQQDRFYRAMISRIETSDIEMRERLKQTLSSIESGLANVGIERCNDLRVAKREGCLIASMPYGEQCTPGCLMAAFADWKLTRSVDDCRRQLRRAWSQAQKDADEFTGPIGRFLGNLYLHTDDTELAWPLLQISAELDHDAGAILDAAKLAIKLRKWDQAKSLLETGFVASPLFCLRVLADATFEEVAGDALQLMAETQREARKVAASQISRWSNETNRAKQAAKTAQVGLEFVSDHDQRRKTIAPRVSAADLFESLSISHQAIASCRDCNFQASQTMSALYHEAAKELESAKSMMDLAWVEREATIESALVRQRQEVQEARDALQASLKESDKNQTGCVVGLGSGCGAFLLYLFIAGFLATRGINAGFGTIFGWFGLAASGVPITIAVIAQLTYGTQRSLLDKALHEKIKVVQEAYEVAAKNADQTYRQQVLKLRDSLGDIEARAQRLEEGLKILNAAS